MFDVIEVAIHPGPVSSWPEFAAAQDAVQKVGEAEQRVSALVAEERDLLGDLGVSTTTHDPESFLSDATVRRQLDEMSATTMPIGQGERRLQ